MLQREFCKIQTSTEEESIIQLRSTKKAISMRMESVLFVDLRKEIQIFCWFLMAKLIELVIFAKYLNCLSNFSTHCFANCDFGSPGRSSI